MAQAATAPTNGAQKTKTAPSAQASNLATIAAPAVKVEQKKDETPEQPKVRSIQDELERIRLRADLADKFGQLVATKARFEAFRFKGDNLREKVILRDEMQQEFTTCNTAVVEAVYALIGKTLDEKIAGLEAELLATA